MPYIIGKKKNLQTVHDKNHLLLENNHVQINQSVKNYSAVSSPDSVTMAMHAYSVLMVHLIFMNIVTGCDLPVITVKQHIKARVVYQGRRNDYD